MTPTLRLGKNVTPATAPPPERWVKVNALGLSRMLCRHVMLSSDLAYELVAALPSATAPKPRAPKPDEDRAGDATDSFPVEPDPA